MRRLAPIDSSLACARRPLAAVTLAIAAAALAGCASLHELTSDVSTYSTWPAQRQPGRFTFERLPSQRGNPDQQKLEDAARPALEHAGFRFTENEAEAEVSVQLGVQVAYSVPYPYGDPFWWRGGFYGRFGRGFGMGLGMHSPMVSYTHQVVVIVRDRKGGQALYEARAASDSLSPTIGDGALPALFQAALADFPYGGPSPRKVTTPLP